MMGNPFGLNKQAAGLPRFMMDCGWWRNGKKWRRSSLAELGLHQAGISFANEHGTDGVLPGPVDDLAVALSLPVKEVARTLPKLIERGAWTQRDDDDYEIADFLSHNPSRSEVEADRKRRQLNSLHANHTRHHVKKKIRDEACPFCSDPDSLSESDKESDKESQAHSRRKDGTDGRMKSVPVPSDGTPALRLVGECGDPSCANGWIDAPGMPEAQPCPVCRPREETA